MKDPILEKALIRRAELQKKLDEIDRFVKTYNTLKGDGQGKPKGWGGRGSATKDILDAVANILSNENPLKPADIVSRLEDKGIRITGSNPANNLSAKLSGAKGRFKTLGRGKGWTLLK